LPLRRHTARRAAITIVYQLYGERKFPSRALQGHSQKNGPINFKIKHRDGAAPATEGEIKMTMEDARKRREAPLETPSNFGSNAIKDISAALTVLLADVFALYVKTKNFHWHVSGPHFRDYHLLLDEQAAQIFAMTDDIAERARKIGGTTIRSIGHIARVKHI